MNQQRASVEWIEAHDGVVEYDFDEPISFSNRSVVRVGELKHADPSVDYRHAVVNVAFRARRVLNAAGVGGPGFRIKEDKKTTAGTEQAIPLEKLATLRHLEELSVCNVGSANLSALSVMRKLRLLRITCPNVSDARPLARLKNLQHLTILKSAIQDLSPLSRCTELEWLYLEGAGIDDLRPLADLPSLEYLSLPGASLSDLTPLLEIKSLRRLDFSGTKTTDWQSLTKMKQLDFLWLDDDEDFSFDIATLEKIKAALPGTKVVHMYFINQRFEAE